MTTLEQRANAYGLHVTGTGTKVSLVRFRGGDQENQHRYTETTEETVEKLDLLDAGTLVIKDEPTGDSFTNHHIHDPQAAYCEPCHFASQ